MFRNTMFDRMAMERNLEAAVLVKGFPRCFISRAQYEEWCSMEKICHTVLFRRNICEDCSRMHKDRMMQAGRCANPESVIISD